MSKKQKVSKTVPQPIDLVVNICALTSLFGIAVDRPAGETKHIGKCKFGMTRKVPESRIKYCVESAESEGS